ncbi:MAG: DNA alkylation repair protein [Bacteroidetes bacterium]|nr:DNA alkylation repair protein [Bacteroidota bacterium]
MELKIREIFLNQAECGYQKFTAKLIPTSHNIIGVRMPFMRNLAKQIVKDDWQEYLRTADDYYFEEVMLQGLVIGLVKIDVSIRLEYMRKFISKIDNWSVCDSFCIGLKFAQKNQQEVWDFIEPYSYSENEYVVRFSVVTMLAHFINDNYIDRVLAICLNISHDEYYAKMGVAWALSVCFVKFPQKTFVVFQSKKVEKWTHNKAIQKCIESFRVKDEDKMVLRALKQK